eukprot:scaffold3818_cov155-Ochromonas_danica.AAC.4
MRRTRRSRRSQAGKASPRTAAAVAPSALCPRGRSRALDEGGPALQKTDLSPAHQVQSAALRASPRRLRSAGQSK